MSEELTYQERSLYVQEDFTSELLIQDFIDTVRNEKLAFGLRRLTDRQRHGIFYRLHPAMLLLPELQDQPAGPWQAADGGAPG